MQLKKLKTLKTHLLSEAFVIPKDKAKEMSTLILQYSLNNVTNSAKKLLNLNNIEFKFDDDIGCFVKLSENNKFILKLNSTLILDSAIYIKYINKYICLYDLFSNKSYLSKILDNLSLDEKRSLFQLISYEKNKDFISVIRKYS